MGLWGLGIGGYFHLPDILIGCMGMVLSKVEQEADRIHRSECKTNSN